MCIDLAYLVGVRGRRRVPTPRGHPASPPHPHLWGGLEGPDYLLGAPSRPPQKEYSVVMYGSVVTLSPITLSLPGLGCRNDLLKILLPGVAVLDRDPAHALQVAALGGVVRARERLLEGPRQVGHRAAHLTIQRALMFQLLLKPCHHPARLFG